MVCWRGGRRRTAWSGDVLAWKMPGAGGGGYLAMVVKDVDAFCNEHAEGIKLSIRR